MDKYKEENGLVYELGEHGMYYPVYEKEEKRLTKYGKMAKEYMKSIREDDYEFLEILDLLPMVFNEVDERANQMIDRIMEQKLEAEPIDYDNWNILEIERHKKMLLREAEEFVRMEYINTDHFKGKNILDLLKKENPKLDDETIKKRLPNCNFEHYNL